MSIIILQQDGDSFFLFPLTILGTDCDGLLDAAGQGLPATPKSQTLSPGLGMAPSPGTLLPHLPLHAHHMSQASLINSPQASCYPQLHKHVALDCLCYFEDLQRLLKLVSQCLGWLNCWMSSQSRQFCVLYVYNMQMMVQYCREESLRGNMHKQMGSMGTFITAFLRACCRVICLLHSRQAMQAKSIIKPQLQQMAQALVMSQPCGMLDMTCSSSMIVGALFFQVFQIGQALNKFCNLPSMYLFSDVLFRTRPCHQFAGVVQYSKGCSC